MHVGELDEEWRQVEAETGKMATAVLQRPRPMALRVGRTMNQMTRVKNALARRVWASTKPLRSKRNAVSPP
jgi:hypothetical protein